jgi:hypothetical protein
MRFLLSALFALPLTGVVAVSQPQQEQAHDPTQASKKFIVEVDNVSS